MSLPEETNGALLDTDFLIDLHRGKRNPWRIRAQKLLVQINTEDLYVSNITVTEFITGIPIDKLPVILDTLPRSYSYVAPTYREAALAGSLRREWLSKGYTLSIADTTNAAIAISRRLVLVTRNSSHYPFEQLTICGW